MTVDEIDRLIRPPMGSFRNEPASIICGYVTWVLLDDFVLRNIIPTTKDEPHTEAIQEHLKALANDDRKLFEKRVKDTGVTHEVKNLDEILKKTK